MKTCIGCKSEIHSAATVCEKCGSSQGWLKFKVSQFSNSFAAIISVISLLISVLAYYQSQKKVPIEAEIVAQVVNLNEGQVDIQVFNNGNAPTVIDYINFRATLSRGGGNEGFNVDFDLVNPIELGPNNFQLLQLKYEDYDRRNFSGWFNSVPAPEGPFDPDFMRLATQMGNNLACEIEIYFISNSYYFTHSSKKIEINGQCTGAMIWYQKHFSEIN